MISEYMSLKIAAAKWRSKPWYIAKAYDEGQVPGAAKVDGEWIIPADMERPPMHISREEPKPNPIQHGSEYKDSIYRMTMQGFPDFNVITKKYGNTTYIISGMFSPSATRTVTEHMVSLALHDMGGDVTPEVKKLAKELCEESRKDIPRDDELRRYYLDKFTEIGFTQEEITELMAKIDEHIETRRQAFERKRR